MEPEYKDVGVTLNNYALVFIAIIVLLAFFVAIKLSKKYGIGDTMVNTLKKYAPLVLIFTPPILTYLFICGALSATAFAVYQGIRTAETIDREEFLFMEKGIEFICSFFVPLAYFSLLKKYKFEFFWSFIITIVHVLAAGYRDAKFVKFDKALTGKTMASGPQILADIHWLDASIPLLSLMVFMVLISHRIKTSESIS